MADNNLYLDSLKFMSVALEKSVALSSIRGQIKNAYSRIPSSPGNDHKMMMDTLFDALLHISKLQDDEKELKRSYVEELNKTINSIISYIYTIDKADLNEPYIASLQKYLQVLLEVISSSSTIMKEGTYSIDAVRAHEVLQKFSTYGGIPQADNIIEKIKKMFTLIGISYVG